MSEHLLDITSHIIPASHIRDFSESAQDERKGHLRFFFFKKDQQKGKKAEPGDPTLILAHGISYCKEP